MTLPSSLDTIDIWDAVRRSKPVEEGCTTRTGAYVFAKNKVHITYTLCLENKRTHYSSFHISTQYINEDGRDLDRAHQNIQLIKSKCNFGGYRLWFLCPTCEKRLGTLHTQNYSRWGCTKCIGVDYLSKQLYPSLRKDAMVQDILIDDLIRFKSKHIKRATWNGKLTKKVDTLRKYCDSVGRDYRAYLPKRSKLYMGYDENAELKALLLQRDLYS